MTKKDSAQKGSTILLSLLVISSMLLIASGAATLFINEIRQAAQVASSANAYMAAEIAFERARGYAANGATTTGIIRDQKVSTTDPSVYDFQTVAAGSNYDEGGSRFCNPATIPATLYCYFGVGRSEGARRKLEGFRTNTVAATADLVSTIAPIAFPSVSSKAATFKMYSVEPVSPNVHTVIYKGTVDLANLNYNANSLAVGGIFDPVLNDGIGLSVKYNGSGGWNFGLRKYNTDGTLVAPDYFARTSPTDPNTMFVSVNSVKFNLTLRRKGTDPANHSISLQLNNAATGACLGIKTFKFIPTEATYTGPYFGNNITPIRLIYSYGLNSRPPTFSSNDLRVYDISVDNVNYYATFKNVELWAYSNT